MAENTKIQWADHTFNPWVGCEKVNEGCKNCYAEFMMDTRYHRVQWGPNGTRSRTKTWGDPKRWNREAAEIGEKRKVFCASLADVFEDREELFEWREDLFQLIDACENLYWLLLTKRPENISRMWAGEENGEREHVWLGTSIANQRNADLYVDRLLEARNLSPVLFLSVEPQIDFVDLSPWLKPEPLIHWVIVGGESKQGGAEPRPFHVEWARDMVMQCQDADVPVFVKQLGSNVYQRNRPIKLRDSHGGDMAEWPEDIRVRECPESLLFARSQIVSHETDFLPVGPAADEPWQTDYLVDVARVLECERHCLETMSLLSKDIDQEFRKLISMLERDIEGMNHANRMG